MCAKADAAVTTPSLRTANTSEAKNRTHNIVTSMGKTGPLSGKSLSQKAHILFEE
jgi:hypothetical protein